MVGFGAYEGRVIGVTGLIGSGKSRASRFLATQLSCPHIDADQIARDLMAPGHLGWVAIKNFDRRYIMADGSLDRVQLRHDIFAESAVRKAVDCLVHPLVRQEFLKMLQAHSAPQVVVEVPLLFEAGWDDLCDVVVLVYAEKDVCLQRVVLRDGVSVKQVERAYASQMGAEQKIARADHVIDNNGCWWNTQLQLLHLVDILTG